MRHYTSASYSPSCPLSIWAKEIKYLKRGLMSKKPFHKKYKMKVEGECKVEVESWQNSKKKAFGLMKRGAEKRLLTPFLSNFFVYKRNAVEGKHILFVPLSTRQERHNRDVQNSTGLCFSFLRELSSTSVVAV